MCFSFWANKPKTGGDARSVLLCDIYSGVWKCISKLLYIYNMCGGPDEGLTFRPARRRMCRDVFYSRQSVPEISTHWARARGRVPDKSISNWYQSLIIIMMMVMTIMIIIVIFDYKFIRPSATYGGNNQVGLNTAARRRRVFELWSTGQMACTIVIIIIIIIIIDIIIVYIFIVCADDSEHSHIIRV